MKKTEKHEQWVKYEDVTPTHLDSGVERRVLAYTDGVMCVEHKFKKGDIGAIHTHPHTQITYVISGEFIFEIDGIKKTVNQGDTLLKENGINHGCVCTADGALLDVFVPMRDDFID